MSPIENELRKLSKQVQKILSSDTFDQDLEKFIEGDWIKFSEWFLRKLANMPGQPRLIVDLCYLEIDLEEIASHSGKVALKEFAKLCSGKCEQFEFNQWLTCHLLLRRAES